MNTLRLKIIHRDAADWRYQITDGRGDVVAERRFLPDRVSAARIGEQERLKLAARIAHQTTMAHWRMRIQASA